VSRSKRSVAVSRSYKPAPNACARALQLLLKVPVCKEGDPATAPVDARKDQDARTSSYST
jgi:hypothetical protein